MRRIARLPDRVIRILTLSVWLLVDWSIGLLYCRDSPVWVLDRDVRLVPDAWAGYHLGLKHLNLIL